MKRMESRLAVINSVNESFQNWILSWKDSVGELLKIKDNTNETKVCELIETATGILIIPDSLEAYHCLPSGQNDKLIIKFSRGKMLKWFCQKKKQLRASILAAFVLKVVKSIAMKVFAPTISSYRVNILHLWSTFMVIANVLALL